MVGVLAVVGVGPLAFAFGLLLGHERVALEVVADVAGSLAAAVPVAFVGACVV